VLGGGEVLGGELLGGTEILELVAMLLGELVSGVELLF
jgi:hypothetical protein